MRRGTALVVATLVFAACSDSTPPATTRSALDPFSGRASSSPPAMSTGPSVLLVGQCFDADGFTSGSSIARSGVHVVDCSAPHEHEVYAVVADPDGPDVGYPGDDAMASVADDLCLAAFTPTFGVDYQASSLDFASIRPDRSAWDAGERTIVCAVHDTDFQSLSGSHVPSTTMPSSLSTESG